MKSLVAQRGVGLMEVLVALVILAIGILGFSALQLRGIEATQEANEQSVAMNLARDLAERMRINRTALATYKTAINDKYDSKDDCVGITAINNGSDNLALPICNSVAMAEHDASEIIQKAENMGQTVVVAGCVKSNVNCIYVAWGPTTITSTSLEQCIDTTTGAYLMNSKCLVMEAF